MELLICIFLKSDKIVKIDIIGVYNIIFFYFLFGLFEVEVGQMKLFMRVFLESDNMLKLILVG